ncbi:hypothetical protein FGO68_gene5799 [Halteria grandinella]|uniref:Uncharacterized protein n=1 Tax=Halteria grandinella TaxID=5974 RepID=A0A8J8P4W1_HALGN|nr:hypothetical protein FGO68_gene5799 [Halteria grandinella]
MRKTHAALGRHKLDFYSRIQWLLISLHHQKCWDINYFFVTLCAICFVKTLTEVANVVFLRPMSQPSTFQVKYFRTIFTKDHVTGLSTQVAVFIAVKTHWVFNIVSCKLLWLIKTFNAFKQQALIGRVYLIFIQFLLLSFHQGYSILAMPKHLSLLYIDNCPFLGLHLWYINLFIRDPLSFALLIEILHELKVLLAYFCVFSKYSPEILAHKISV